jgi:hypothetical protein
LTINVTNRSLPTVMGSNRSRLQIDKFAIESTKLKQMVGELLLAWQQMRIALAFARPVPEHVPGGYNDARA